VAVSASQAFAVNQDILSQLRQEVLKLKTENSYLRADIEKQKQIQQELESNFHNTINQLRSENIDLIEQVENLKSKIRVPDNSVCHYNLSLTHSLILRLLSLFSSLSSPSLSFSH
jgi:predicted RNase H-like nuclease (RuvC/YqgF family)